jgi:hypothetical protein
MKEVRIRLRRKPEAEKGHALGFGRVFPSVLEQDLDAARMLRRKL